MVDDSGLFITLIHSHGKTDTTGNFSDLNLAVLFKTCITAIVLQLWGGGHNNSHRMNNYQMYN